jgi:hypothetical protein
METICNKCNKEIAVKVNNCKICYNLYIKDKMRKYRAKQYIERADGVKNTDADYIWIKISDLHEININGIIRNIKTGRHLKTFINKGYVSVCFNLKIKMNCLVHRLLAIAFIEKDNIYADEVDHIDRNTLNNNINNLRWVTKHENSQNRNFSKICLEHIEDCNMWRLKKDKVFTYYNTLDKAYEYMKTL